VATVQAAAIGRKDRLPVSSPPMGIAITAAAEPWAAGSPGAEAGEETPRGIQSPQGLATPPSTGSTAGTAKRVS
jgi:hypothetical protein